MVDSTPWVGEGVELVAADFVSLGAMEAGSRGDWAETVL